MGHLKYDECRDDVIDLSWLTLTQHLEREAARFHEPILQAVIGNWRGAPEWVEAEGWPGWVDPVPLHKRLRVEPWDRVAPALSYNPRKAGGMHPVTAWTASWVIVARLVYMPDVTAYPRSPRAYEQELLT